MTLNAVIRCSSCNRISKKSGSKDNKCSQCLEIERLKDELKHSKHNNKTLRRSNTAQKAIIKRLKQYEPEQTFYDDGRNYLKGNKDNKG